MEDAEDVQDTARLINLVNDDVGQSANDPLARALDKARAPDMWIVSQIKLYGRKNARHNRTGVLRAVSRDIVAYVS